MLPKADIQPIGLDIGHDSVRMLQLAVNGNTLAVRGAASRRLELNGSQGGEQALGIALQTAADLIEQGGFAGRSVVTALPREIVHIKNLRLPLMPAAELPAAISFEARNVFPFNAESAYVDYLTAGEVRQGTEARQEVIVLAAKHGDVDAFVERLDRVGLRVASLDAEPCALYRTVERFIRRRDDEQEVNVLLDIGLRRTQVIIGRGRELSFFKPIDIGGQRLNDAVAKRLGITFEEARALRWRLAQAASDNAAGAVDDKTSGEAVRQAVFHAVRGALEELAREVSLCLRYYSVTFRGPGPARVRLMGGEARDPHLAAVLKAVLSIPAEPSHPLYNVDASAMNPPDSEWATAVGLALKKTNGKFAAKDGTPRSMRAGMGEVVDLNQAVAGSASSGASSVSSPSASSAVAIADEDDGSSPEVADA